MEMTRRNKLEILGCILNICKTDGSSKTKIVYQVNLNFKNAGLYLEWLTSHGYLVKEEKLYKTTPTGHELLQNLNNINSTINDNIESVLARNEKILVYAKIFGAKIKRPTITESITEKRTAPAATSFVSRAYG